MKVSNFEIVGSGLCELDELSEVTLLHKCLACGKKMCTECLEGHTTAFCENQKDKQSEVQEAMKATRTFRTVGMGNCSCEHSRIQVVHLHQCDECKEVMCAECAGKHIGGICSEQDGKQSEIHCRPDMMPLATLKIAEVCDTGLKKYDADNLMLSTIGPISPNWHKITSRDHINHALYHIYQQLSGSTNEEHLAHAACRIMFALEMDLRGK